MYTKDSFCSRILRKKYENATAIVLNKEYCQFSIPKKNGKRVIHYLEKDSELALLQKNLLKNFLDKQPLPVCVKGFKKSENFNTFLIPHADSKYFLRIDIKSFFPSLKTEVIKRELSNILNFDSQKTKDEILNLICDIVSLDGCLPQGAYTSPAVSNHVMARTDQRILKYCQTLGIKYTRYADDLLFSSDTFCFKEKKWFLKKVKYILAFNDLVLNYSKVKYAEDELVLNGYVLSAGEIRLSRSKLHDIRRVASFVKDNCKKIEDGESSRFLTDLNNLDLRNRNLNENEFTTVFQVIQYLNGNRAFLISMIQEDYNDSKSQKDLRKLIRKLENRVNQLYKAL